MLAEGSVFAAYEVRRRIAVGGMGEVYLCRHRMLDRLDAVKVLRPHLASDSDFRRRFLREALSAARLRHPHVVTVYTADEADGLLYLAMEYVVGEDLGTLLTGGRLDAARTVRLMRVVADALDAAHRAQLVHRDIKPSNLLVTRSGTAEESVTLVDFGISRILDADSEITRTGEIVGTIAYMSPEQLANRAVVGGACDQYALACVAFECLTGRVPFPREGQLAVMTAHLTAPPPAVTALRPELPAAVDAVIARAMAKDPQARFPTCTQFVAALEAALPASLSASADHGDFLAPATLAAKARSGHRDLVRPAGHPDTLALRVGWSPGPPATPMVMPLMSGSLAVRGESLATAACVRWLIAQAVTRHRPREVCLVHAAAPADGENWLWVSWLPHARPSTPPISGPHVATGPEAAADLHMRLRELVSSRRTDGSGSPTWSTRVLAVLDARLGAQTDDAGLADAGRYGVHPVYLLRPGEAAPADTSTLDISGDGTTCRLARAGAVPVDGAFDAVDGAYVRDLVDVLPDD